MSRRAGRGAIAFRKKAASPPDEEEILESLREDEQLRAELEAEREAQTETPEQDESTLEKVYPELSADFEEVDAEKAERWLSTQVKNRPAGEDHIAELVADMLAGQWLATGETVKFDWHGRLVDGQHRLKALVVANKTMPGIVLSNLLVVRGVAPESQAVMDTNRRRTAAHNLAMSGVPHASAMAATAKQAIIWDRGALYLERRAQMVTHAQIGDYIQENPDLITVVGRVMNSLNRHIDMPPAAIATGYWILWRIAPEDADEFYARLADGVALERGDPILTLRQKLREISRSRFHIDIFLSLTFRAWNARRKGKQMKRLPVFVDEEPVICPDPI